ncbi:hypothetical protein AK812_SmicGene7668 [Symbiodinium microadriaticum]|uniref:Uncharacterized protein n=1 Tax=Symbiodinium microadriaticum TaxID=2951 RepID=A0A1Q9EMZ9_SYMMI|nr:hypothetical protein AK812_SmicGene7668 [Symbiodinium microadriaticum]
MRSHMLEAVAAWACVKRFRQLVEYPPISEEDQIKLKGTLKQPPGEYREWEAAELKKMRNAGKKEDPKAKAKKDKAKEKAKEKGKKGKKGKKEEEVVVEAKEIPPDPAFAQVGLLPWLRSQRGRPRLESRFSGESEPDGLEGADLEAESVEVPKGAPEEAEEEALAPVLRVRVETGLLLAVLNDSMQDQENIAPVSAVTGSTGDQDSLVKKGKKRLSVAEQARPELINIIALHLVDEHQTPATCQVGAVCESVSTFELPVARGVGMLDPDSKPRQGHVKRVPTKHVLLDTKRLLQGEPVEEPEQEASPENQAEDEEVEDGWPGATFGAPDGPTWDVYGEPRGPKLGKRMNVQIVPPAIRALQGKISQAYVGVNADYMEVEGPTGRKTNTAALAHKRSHVKGLGDNHMLVEVMPGACRFGPLHDGRGASTDVCGQFSKIRSVYVRNLEVDVTRHGNQVDGRGKTEKSSRDCRRADSQAHIVRVPITARIVGAEEPGPVQLITEPSYCKKVMGPTWQPPPVEFDDLPATELLRAINYRDCHFDGDAIRMTTTMVTMTVTMTLADIIPHVPVIGSAAVAIAASATTTTTNRCLTSITVIFIITIVIIIPSSQLTTIITIILIVGVGIGIFIKTLTLRVFHRCSCPHHNRRRRACSIAAIVLITIFMVILENLAVTVTAPSSPQRRTNAVIVIIETIIAIITTTSITTITVVICRHHPIIMSSIIDATTPAMIILIMAITRNAMYDLRSELIVSPALNRRRWGQEVDQEVETENS